MNPCDDVILPKMAHREISFYSASQLNDLFNAIKNEPLYPLIYFTAIYGLRRSEVLGLKWDSVNFENNTITIKHTVVRFNNVFEKDSTKTSSSYRSYPLTEEVKNILTMLKEAEKKNIALFGPFQRIHPFLAFVDYQFQNALKANNNFVSDCDWGITNALNVYLNNRELYQLVCVDNRMIAFEKLNFYCPFFLDSLFDGAEVEVSGDSHQ